VSGPTDIKASGYFPERFRYRRPKDAQDGGEKMNKAIDFEAIERELDAEFTETAPVEEEQVLETQEQEPLVEEVDEEEYVEEDSEDYEEEEPVNDPDEHKRNEAFKKLREERDQLAESDKFLNDLAAQYGLTKDELIKRYQEEANSKKAKESGMTPEQYKELQDMKQRLEQTELERKKQVFNYEAQKIADKYNLSENEMVDIFTYAQSNGIAITDNPSLIEFAYRAKNYDNALEQGRQKQLETTKKRRQTSVGQTGTQKAAPPVDEYAAMEAEIDAYLKEQKIIK
jgi:hypothetical protein